MFTVTDGSYYFTASVPAYDGIVLRRAGTLAWNFPGQGSHGLKKNMSPVR